MAGQVNEDDWLAAQMGDKPAQSRAGLDF